jgi:hypothetical protein
VRLSALILPSITLHVGGIQGNLKMCGQGPTLVASAMGRRVAANTWRDVRPKSTSALAVRWNAWHNQSRCNRFHHRENYGCIPRFVRSIGTLTVPACEWPSMRLWWLYSSYLGVHERHGIGRAGQNLCQRALEHCTCALPDGALHANVLTNGHLLLIDTAPIACSVLRSETLTSSTVPV